MSLGTLLGRCLGERDGLSIAQGQVRRWEAWLTPISAASPTGEDPAYNDDFQHMREEVNKLSGADVAQVIELAQKLLMHTCKDLRVATYYLWARLHKDGEAGLADGLTLLAALVERFGEQLLPARPTSRKAALEWLAAGKVLDSLSLYPEVVKEESERTAAALAWLEQGVAPWPQEHQPALEQLYGALSARLAQSGGADALIPQNATPSNVAAQNAGGSASGQAPVQQSAAIRSGRDLLDNGRTLASYLRDQPLGWLAAHRLMKSLRWDTVHQAPPQDTRGQTRLAPPRGEYRAQLKRLYVQQSWTELLDQAERIYAEGVNHFWLDLQWYLFQALSKQPTPQNHWAELIKGDLSMLLDRLPGLEALSWSDGTPFAEQATREWIDQQVRQQAQPWAPVAGASGSMGDEQILDLEGEALAQADAEGVEKALAWLAERPEASSGRHRWLLRLLMARVAERHGKSDLAIHLLTELDAQGQRHGLGDWEPALLFEVKARLLKLLRVKAQRNEADKPALARSTQTLLAALVVIDPVRAAVLCG